MATALVVGANGQDGTFLVRHLLAKQYRVAGLGRQERSRWEIPSPLFTYHRVDLNEAGALPKLLERIEPDLIFHVAAVHTSAGGGYEAIFDSVLRVNVASLHAILEHMRKTGRGRLCYASSAKVFGSPLPERIDENTALRSQCLYSISKNAAFHLIDFYRKTHAVNASVVHLFNHESELRPQEFFIPKLVRALALALSDEKSISEVNTLEFHCDWGSADEYMEILIAILEAGGSDDFVLATGESTYARELARRLFARFGLDYERHIKERDANVGVGQPPYRVDLGRLERRIHRAPQVGIESVCNDILRIKFKLPA
jgi:GDPmannose 4,6-dehydratase